MGMMEMSDNDPCLIQEPEEAISDYVHGSSVDVSPVL